MDTIYYHDPHFNFGDDLNKILWPRILSEGFQQSDVVLIGIGSILTHERLGEYSDGSRQVIVLGSGTSYGTPPQNMDRWSVLAVRGPLTAAVIGHESKAVTDGAILLATVPELTQSALGIKRGKVLFMPHHRSIFTTPWQQLAEEAGMTYVTPQQPPERILEQFAQADLVVTEAMHGAIVADTLRIPWIPIAISPAIEEFKWRDWCASLDLPFAPTLVPAASAADRDRFAFMRTRLERIGLPGFRNVDQHASADALRAYLQQRFAPGLKNLYWKRRHPALRLLRAAQGVANPLYRKETVEALRQVARQKPFLSRENVFRSRLAQMQDAVAAAERMVCMPSLSPSVARQAPGCIDGSRRDSL